jgi:hypothetical protein
MSETVNDPRRVAPTPRVDGIEEFEGKWVAVLDGEVVAAEPTSRALAARLRTMDHRRRREAVVQYVRPTSDSYIVGVG